jgi:hypothetical protein
MLLQRRVQKCVHVVASQHGSQPDKDIGKAGPPSRQLNIASIKPAPG